MNSRTWAKEQHWPVGVYFGMDIFRPLYDTYRGDGHTGMQIELNTSMYVASWMLEGDYGWGKTEWKGDNTTTGTSSSYISHGKYFRIGLNYNLLRATPDKNVAFLGFRYARSFLQDRLVSKVHYRHSDQKDNRLIKNDGTTINEAQDNVKACWFEAVAGVKVKIWKLLYVGSTIRYKFNLRFDQIDTYIPYDVLGWGLSGTDNTFGFNCYLSLCIPVVRDQQPQSPEA